MKKSRFTETQIVSILNEADAGIAVKDICRKHGIAPATYYKWKSKYGGLGASELKRIKELEAEGIGKITCRVLRVHRSGYYAWLKQPLSDRAIEDRRLSALIKESHEATDATADVKLPRLGEVKFPTPKIKTE